LPTDREYIENNSMVQNLVSKTATVIVSGQLDAEIKNPFTEGCSSYQRLAVGGSASKIFLLPKSCLNLKEIT
jgi:hypothetical protein